MSNHEQPQPLLITRQPNDRRGYRSPFFLRKPEVHYSLPIHELGGFRPQDWEKVLDKMGEPGTEVEQRIATYANHVIAGELPAGNFDARNYLGRRHWERISRCFIIGNNFTGSIEKGKKRFGFTSYVFSPTIEHEMKVFADFEADVSYTVEDYIIDNMKKIKEEESEMPVELSDSLPQGLSYLTRSWLVWKPDLQEWHVREKYHETLWSPSGNYGKHEEQEITYRYFRGGGEYTTGSEEVEVYDDPYIQRMNNYYYYEALFSQRYMKELRDRWLLTPEDISDEELPHTPQETLAQLLRDKAQKNPEIAPAFRRGALTTTNSRSRDFPRYLKYWFDDIATHSKKQITKYFNQVTQAHTGSVKDVYCGIDLFGNSFIVGIPALLDMNSQKGVSEKPLNPLQN